MADRSAFEGFYREHVSRVIRACRLVLVDREEAEDVAAEAFARLWSRWGAIKDDDHAGGFVFKTAMRLCARHAKRRRRAPVDGLDPPARDDVAQSLGRDALERAAGRGEPPDDRLLERVLRRGRARATARWIAIVAAVAIFAGGVTWAGLAITARDRRPVPAAEGLAARTSDPVVGLSMRY